MPVKEVTCILQLPNWYGQTMSLGLATLNVTESLPRLHTIDIMIEGSCAKKLVMELITEASRGHLPIRLRLKSD